MAGKSVKVKTNRVKPELTSPPEHIFLINFYVVKRSIMLLPNAESLSECVTKKAKLCLLLRTVLE